jgi:hypothetical protein
MRRHPTPEQMPLSDNEQRILEEIERRLKQDDPRFANAVARAGAQGHLARRVRLGVLGFLIGFLMLMLFAWSVWVAIAGFGVMLASALFVYHQLRRAGRDQLDRYQSGGPLSITAALARLAERFRGRGRT